VNFQRALPHIAAFFLAVGAMFCSSCNQGDGGGEVQLPMFTNVAVPAGIGDVGGLGQTAAWGDANGDGRQDLFIANTDRPPERNVFLYRNEGGIFIDETFSSGITDESISSASWADYDNDGLLDLALGTSLSGAPAKLYRNIGGFAFEDVSTQAGITSGGGNVNHVVWADYDRDGLVDLFQASSGVSPLYRNLGDGTFEDVTFEAGLGGFFATRSALWFDFNGDLFPDLFLANNGANKLYLNNGDGTFTDVTPASGVAGAPSWNSSAACAGDYDGDGFLDLYVVNIESPRNALYHNNGDGTFTDVTLSTGTEDVGDGRTCAWVDFDGDGRLDLFTTNHLSPTRLYRNLGTGRFEDVAGDVGLSSPIDVFAATWGDYNGDGFIDAFLYGHLGFGLFENGGNANNFIVLSLVGDGIHTNRSAIGTRVEVRSAGGVRIREVSGGRGCCEQDMLPLHFGMGEDAEADILVRWTSGSECFFPGLSIDGGRIYLVREADCSITEL
jgi:hypothetical protein